MPTRPTDSVTAADRVLRVLAVLAQAGRALSAAELMARTGLARSTLYRQLGHLKRWGFVLENEGLYAPGPLSLQLAFGFDLASDLARQVRPELEALAQQSRESVALVVAVNDKVICLDMVDSEQSLRCSFEKGRGVPLDVGASAKCLLAHLPEAGRQTALARRHPTDLAARVAAETELGAIARNGYAVTSGEVDPGVWGVSAPVFSNNRQALGAITLMAPVSRLAGQDQTLIQMTVVAAARISRTLTTH